MNINDLYKIKNGHTGKVVAEGLDSNFSMLAKELNANNSTAAIKSLKGYGKEDVPTGISILTTDGDFILPAEWGTLGVGKTADGIMVSDGTHFTVFNTTIGQNLAFGPINNDIGGIPNITDPAVARLDFDGKAHSAALTEANPAYAYCLGLGPDYYLPAAGQLYDAMQGSTEFNKALEALGLPLLADGDAFWSSTEIDLDKAWAVGYPIGATISADKTIQYKVFAVKDYVAPQDALLSEDNTLNEALRILSSNTKWNIDKIEDMKITGTVYIPKGAGNYELVDIKNTLGNVFFIHIKVKYRGGVNKTYSDSIIALINSRFVINNESPNCTILDGLSNLFDSFTYCYTSGDNNDNKIAVYKKVDQELYVDIECIPFSDGSTFTLHETAIKRKKNIPDELPEYSTQTNNLKYRGVRVDYLGGVYISDFLFKNRDLPFTPTKDYEPATKKYVDDQQDVVTQEEYDTLGEVVNTDNKIYFITEP